MSGWTIYRIPLPSWNSRKGRQVVLCCACWVDRSFLFCLCSSNPQLIQSVHPRPLSSHSNAWPCALLYCSVDDVYESIKSAHPQRVKTLISIACMCRPQIWKKNPHFLVFPLSIPSMPPRQQEMVVVARQIFLFLKKSWVQEWERESQRQLNDKNPTGPDVLDTWLNHWTLFSHLPPCRPPSPLPFCEHFRWVYFSWFFFLLSCCEREDKGSTTTQTITDTEGKGDEGKGDKGQGRVQ